MALFISLIAARVDITYSLLFIVCATELERCLVPGLDGCITVKIDLESGQSWDSYS